MKISDDELKKINETQRKKILQYVAEKYGKPEEFSSVCLYTFISIILCSFMVECRDLALNRLLTVGGSWDSFETNGTGLTSLQSLPPFWT
jgi:hypothetical protein